MTTTADLHIGVNLGLQKIASNAFDSFLPEEVDYYLNESVKDYIKSQYSVIKTEQRDLQAQFTNENLRTLITTAEVANISVVDYLPNAVKGDLPADYLYYIFSRTKFENKWKNNRRLESKGIKDYLETDYNSPIFREFPVMIEKDNILVIGDTLTNLTNTAQIYLTYIEKPPKIDYKADSTAEFFLPDHTHQEVINIAVDKMLTVIQGRREQ